MSKLDAAKSIADAYFEEIESTVEIRQSYSSIIVGMAGQLMGAFGQDKAAKSTIQNALRHKSVDPGALYKALLVQVNGVFESYIRYLTSAVIEERFEVLEYYTNLDEEFRKDHVVHTARILAHTKDGAIMGSSYNFSLLLENFGKGLSGQKGIKLHPEIYTKLMGNCTPKRIEKLFSSLSLPEPFSNKLGENLELKGHFSDKTKGRVADRAREKLDKQIDIRNDIVHGDLTRTVDLTELKDSIGFFKALIGALDQLVRAC